MSISGINPIGTPKLETENRPPRVDEETRINSRVAKQPDAIDQQTAARAAAGDKQVSAATESLKQEKQDTEKNGRSQVSKDISYAITQQAIKSKDTPQF